jgi:hypothetical protein
VRLGTSDRCDGGNLRGEMERVRATAVFGEELALRIYSCFFTYFLYFFKFFIF